jgi:hypothetical protein
MIQVVGGLVITDDASSADQRETDDGPSGGRRKSSLQPLQVETKQEESSRKQTIQPRWRIVTRYVSLATIAVALTLTCPGETKLWKTASTMTQQQQQLLLDWVRVGQIVGIYGILLVSFFALQGSDPGYLTADMLDQHQEQLATLLSLEEDGRLLTILEDDDDDDDDDGESESQRVVYRRDTCETCQLAPPLRAHHCKQCRKCVATFDHHCGFIGTCIGEANHCRFYSFLSAQLVGFLMLTNLVRSSRLGFTSLLLLQTTSSTSASNNDNGTLIIDIVRVCAAKLFLYPCLLSAMLVWIIHTVLVITNSTTFECSKGSHLEYLQRSHVNTTDFPFHRGILANLRLACQQDRSCVWGWCWSGGKEGEWWKPMLWHPPQPPIRDSEDWWEHPCQNKYWSCC